MESIFPLSFASELNIIRTLFPSKLFAYTRKHVIKQFKTLIKYFKLQNNDIV